MATKTVVPSTRIDFSQPSTSSPIPANLKNSAVLRMLEEQEYEKTTAKANTRQSRARERAIIDRQTVLKINRRHKRRDYSWPPPSALNGSRSRSSSNEIHFDDKVCKRHEILHLREMFDKGVIFEKGRAYTSTMSCDRSTAKGSKNDGIRSYTNNKNSSKSYGVNYEQGKNVEKEGSFQYEWPPKSQFDYIDYDEGGMHGLSNSLINKTYHLPKDQLHFEEIEKIREYFERESSLSHEGRSSSMKKWKSHDSLNRMKSPENMTPIPNEPQCLQRYKSNSYNELLPPQKPKRQFAKNLLHPSCGGSTTKMLNANELLKIDTNGDDIKTTTATTSEISVETRAIIDGSIIREPTTTATTTTATVTSITPTWNDVSIKHPDTKANNSSNNYNDLSTGAVDNNSRNDNEINSEEKCIIEKAAEHAVGNRRKLQRNNAIDARDRMRSTSQPSRRSDIATNIECVPWRRPRHVQSPASGDSTNEMHQQQMYPLQKQYSFDSSERRYFSSANLYLTGSFERAEGYKKVQWPPNDAHYVKGSTPQPSGCPSQQPQQESGDHYQPQQTHPNYPQRPSQSQGHSESYPPKQQQYYQQQHPQQQAHPQQQYHPPQQQPHPYSQQQNRPYNQPQQQQFPRGPASSTVSFSGGVAVNKPAPSQPQSQYQPPYQQHQQPQSPQYQQPQQQYHQPQHQYQAPQQQQQQHYQPPQQQQQQYQPPQQQHQPQSPSGATLSPSYQPTAPSFTHPRSSASPKGWHHVNAARSPTRFGFTQPQPQYQSGAPTSFGSERDLGSHQEPQSYGQPQYQQQNQGYVPTQHQNGRGQSPGIITLRKEAPITQQPAPVYASQPAALGYKGGCNMRGDLKWPPPEYKAQAAAENEERLRLAKQPATRPLLVKKDYSAFFAKHALNSTYPAYKAPPGTQHYAQYAQY